MNRDPSDPDPRTTRTLPAPSPDVVSRRLGDEVVLVHLKTNRIFALSPTGARFWELLSDGATRSDIEATLQREYEVSTEQVAKEIDALLQELQRERLLITHSGE